LRDTVAFIQKTCISSLTDKQGLEAIIQDLIKKQREARQETTNNKFFEKAKMLTVGETVRQEEQRQLVEEQKLNEKARKGSVEG
jgi:hypothetical protein